MFSSQPTTMMPVTESPRANIRPHRDHPASSKRSCEIQSDQAHVSDESCDGDDGACRPGPARVRAEPAGSCRRDGIEAADRGPQHVRSTLWRHVRRRCEPRRLLGRRCRWSPLHDRLDAGRRSCPARGSGGQYLRTPRRHRRILASDPVRFAHRFGAEWR